MPKIPIMTRILMLLVAISLFSCQSHKAEKVEKAVYYWKSDSYYWNDDDTTVQKMGVEKVYAKFFEVEYSETMGNIPVDKTSLHSYQLDSLNIVPTVYIRNEVFLKTTSHAGLDSLADNVNFLISKYTNERFEKSRPIVEYQMDCDWTPKTKDGYFYFLKKLKTLSKKQISCTLRLYPYKYPEKMGIPPVDKAMLMCYNLINPLESRSKNSILDVDELSSYLNTRKKYPLHLDIALPVYSWMLLYQNNQFTKAIYQEHNEVNASLKKIDTLWYEVTKDIVIGDCYLRVGDKIKYEKMTADKIEKAIAVIKKNVVLDPTITVSLFHFDKDQLNQYNHETLARFYSDFSK